MPAKNEIETEIYINFMQFVDLMTSKSSTRLSYDLILKLFQFGNDDFIQKIFLLKLFSLLVEVLFKHKNLNHENASEFDIMSSISTPDNDFQTFFFQERQMKVQIHADFGRLKMFIDQLNLISSSNQNFECAKIKNFTLNFSMRKILFLK
jgi:hypothetical protein